jgi:hypothetical protein
MQNSATPTPLTPSNLSVWAAQVATICGTAVGGTGASGQQLNVEAVPAFGQDDAVANFGVAGSRQSDKIPTQSAPTSMTITAAWNPSDAALLLIRGDSVNGVTDRTFVITASTSATSTIAYAFNGRVSEFQIQSDPSAEAKCVFTIHPRGNQYGWSNN